MNKITIEKVDKYFLITKEAYNLSKENINPEKKEIAKDFLDMISRYISDAGYFYNKRDLVNALVALSYAHGWLDAGARSKIFNVNNSRLFTVD